MIDTIEIEITETKASRLSQVDFDNIPFGKVFSDHMLIIDYADGKWQTPRITPFENLSLSPATSMIHYGQSLFEGLKGFKDEDGNILIFRPEKNWERLNRSAVRLCMPEIPEELFMEGLRKLVSLDRNWVPKSKESSLYIRPFMFATDAFLGVKPSDTYSFMIITAPVGPYYAKPLHLKVETEYTRAAEGGVGFAKAAGNYASALYPAMLAQKQGIDQLIWTDAKEHKYLEEAGTMNMMVVLNDTLVTPPVGSTVLAGVTRDSFLKLAKDGGYKVEERKVSLAEIQEALENGTLTEIFGVGTAATTAQVEKLTIGDVTYELPAPTDKSISRVIGNQLIEIKRGISPDLFDWNVRV